MTTPPQPPGAGGEEPLKPPAKSQKLDPSDSKYAFLLKTPFAKMFERAGATPTIKQMRAIIDQILKQTIREIKRQEKGWKKAMKKMKDAIEGNQG
jgi:ABC-type glycerol-3-phosphate transport system substrate-binding protein